MRSLKTNPQENVQPFPLRSAAHDAFPTQMRSSHPSSLTEEPIELDEGGEGGDGREIHTGRHSNDNPGF